MTAPVREIPVTRQDHTDLVQAVAANGQAIAAVGQAVAAVGQAVAANGQAIKALDEKVDKLLNHFNLT